MSVSLTRLPGVRGVSVGRLAAAGVLCGLLSGGCDKFSKPAAEPVPAPVVEPAPPPQSEPIVVPPRTPQQILAEFEATTPPLQTDDKLRELSEQEELLDQVTELNLGGSAVTDGGTQYLPRFTAVTRLNLSGARVSPRSFEYIAWMPALKRLGFDGIAMDDSALAALTNLSGLEEISLNGNAISDKAFDYLAELDQLRSIQVSGNDHVLGATFTQLVKNRHFQDLKTLIVDGTGFGYYGMHELGRLKQLETFSAAGANVMDEPLQEIRGCSGLRYLNLESNKISNEGLQAITRLRNLEVLRLSGNPAIGDAGLAKLRGLKQLQELRLDGTGCTEPAARELKDKFLKQTTISIAGQEF